MEIKGNIKLENDVEVGITFDMAQVSEILTSTEVLELASRQLKVDLANKTHKFGGEAKASSVRGSCSNADDVKGFIEVTHANIAALIEVGDKHMPTGGASAADKAKLKMLANVTPEQLAKALANIQ